MFIWSSNEQAGPPATATTRNKTSGATGRKHTKRVKEIASADQAQVAAVVDEPTQDVEPTTGANTFTPTWAVGPKSIGLFPAGRFNPWRQGDDAFNPLVASLLSKGGGLLALYVSPPICQKDPVMAMKSWKKISERTGGGWVANPGAIYPLITVFEEQGLVKGKWEDPTKRTVRHYELTETGRTELNRLRAIVKPKLNEALEVLETLANDLERGTHSSSIICSLSSLRANYASHI